MGVIVLVVALVSLYLLISALKLCTTTIIMYYVHILVSGKVFTA